MPKLQNITLSNCESQTIADLINNTDHELDIETNAINLKTRISKISPQLLTLINSIKNDQIDCLVIKNLPNFHNNEFDLIKAKTLSFALSLLVGQPFQYLQQNNGEIIAEVKPLLGYEHTVSSGGRVFLGWHTDDCMIQEDSRAKWIQILGFYNPEHIMTNLAFIDDIVSKLSKKSLNILQTEPYKLIIPASFRIEKMWIDIAPIIYIQNNHYKIGISAYTDIECYNHHSRIALQELIEIADQCKIPINLQSGNAIIFNNSRLLHSRDLIAHYRLVLRTYILPTLDGIRTRANNNSGRIFDLKNLII
jgi:hypothetical protein